VSSNFNHSYFVRKTVKLPSKHPSFIEAFHNSLEQQTPHITNLQSITKLWRFSMLTQWLIKLYYRAISSSLFWISPHDLTFVGFDNFMFFTLGQKNINAEIFCPTRFSTHRGEIASKSVRRKRRKTKSERKRNTSTWNGWTRHCYPHSLYIES
jgi:hypothetical protein